jgi:ribosomal protein L37E
MDIIEFLFDIFFLIFTRSRRPDDPDPEDSPETQYFIEEHIIEHRICEECGKEAITEYQTNCSYCGAPLPQVLKVTTDREFTEREFLKSDDSPETQYRVVEEIMEVRICEECGKEAITEYQTNCSYCGASLPQLLKVTTDREFIKREFIKNEDYVYTRSVRMGSFFYNLDGNRCNSCTGAFSRTSCETYGRCYLAN